MCYVGVIGLIAANATALCLEHFPKISASANAVIGVVEFSMGAVAGMLWAYWHDNSLLPVAGVMLGCSVLGFLSFYLGRERVVTVPE